MTVADRLNELGVTLPSPATPGGNYTPANLVGHTLYVAGQLPTIDGNLVAEGKVGADVTVEQAAEAARIAALNALVSRRERTGRWTGFCGGIDPHHGFCECGAGFLTAVNRRKWRIRFSG